jgi:hypothetical protein
MGTRTYGIAESKVDNLFNQINKKLDNTSGVNGIVENTLKESMFGQFGFNYKLYKETPRKEGFGSF